jgi:hypothetical protein
MKKDKESIVDDVNENQVEVDSDVNEDPKRERLLDLSFDACIKQLKDQ